MLDKLSKVCYNTGVIKVKARRCECHKPNQTFYKKVFCDCDHLVTSCRIGLPNPTPNAVHGVGKSEILVIGI